MTERKFQIKVFPELGFMTVKFFGHIGLTDMIQFTRAITVDPDYSPYFPLICDFRASKAVAYRIDINEFLKKFTSVVSIPQKKKYGLIYSTLNQKFLLSIFKLSGPMLNLEIELFSNLNDCIAWMTSEDKVKEELNDYFSQYKSEDL